MLTELFFFYHEIIAQHESHKYMYNQTKLNVHCYSLFNVLILIYSMADNVALNKPTHQQYRYIGLDASLTQASNAVDGLKSDFEVWGGQCVISENDKQTATWWVNLTSILSIHHIKIYYRTGNVEWGIFFNSKVDFDQILRTYA